MIVNGDFSYDLGISRNGATQNRWFIMDNPTNMDDGWGYPYFRKPPYVRLCNPVPLTSLMHCRHLTSGVTMLC